VPKLAEQCAHLTVFQRTPQWAAPARNRLLTDEEWAALERDIREIRTACEQSPFGHPYQPSEDSAFSVPNAERTAKYQADWDKSGFDFLFGSYGDLLVDESANATVAEFARERIAELVGDPKVAAQLTPDYPFGTKRLPLYPETFYPAFNRDNVDLVSLRSEPIEAIVPQGIRTSRAGHRAGRHRLRHRIRRDDRTPYTPNISGRGGRDLNEAAAPTSRRSRRSSSPTPADSASTNGSPRRSPNRATPDSRSRGPRRRRTP
jgi:cation diffusion facilitator CzcD-associated flavoprotein CzcO